MRIICVIWMLTLLTYLTLHQRQVDGIEISRGSQNGAVVYRRVTLRGGPHGSYIHRSIGYHGWDGNLYDHLRAGEGGQCDRRDRQAYLPLRQCIADGKGVGDIAAMSNKKTANQLSFAKPSSAQRTCPMMLRPIPSFAQLINALPTGVLAKKEQKMAIGPSCATMRPLTATLVHSNPNAPAPRATATCE